MIVKLEVKRCTMMIQNGPHDPQMVPCGDVAEYTCTRCSMDLCRCHVAGHDEACEVPE